MSNVLWGILFGFIGQIISFMQFQGSIKYGWTDRYLWLILLFGVPASWLYLRSVNHFIIAFNGSVWESRLLGFAIGVMVFALMGWILFKEPVTPKTIVSLCLASGIVLTQILWK